MSKIDVEITREALEEFSRMQFGGIEIGGGIYGERVDGAFLVRAFEDHSQDASRYEVRVYLEDLAARHRPDYGLSWLGHFHTHETWKEFVSPSREDRIAWRAMTRKFGGGVFLAMIGAPTGPGSEMTGPTWTGGGDWHAWACEELDGDVEIHQLPVRRVSLAVG